MTRALYRWWPMLIIALLAAPLLTACGGGRAAGPAAATPSEREWVLVQNPRRTDRGSEPEYIWVDRREIPTTLTGAVLGKEAILAPPEAYAKAGPPPGPGRIWRPPEAGGPSAGIAGPAPPGIPAGPPPTGDRRGYVVLVDGMRVVIDLANGEVKKDTLIAITRRQTLTHPVTGEHLGEINLEVGRARVVEVQPKFSVAELIGFKPGLTVRPQDRVTVLPGTP